MQEITKKQYETLVNAYSSKIDFYNPDETYNKLKEMKSKRGGLLTVGYIKNIISAIIWKLKGEDKKDNINKYREILKELKGKSENEERDHKNTHGYIPLWSELVKIRDAVEIPKHHLILCLYTMIPPRRLSDIMHLKISRKGENIDEKYNYYIIDKKKFIWNNYKTAKTYKQQNENCPLKLHKIIMNYIKLREVKDNEYLLNEITRRALMTMINKYFKCGIDNVRHSFINFQYSKCKIPKSEYIEEMARKMGHSLQTHLRYRKYK